MKTLVRAYGAKKRNLPTVVPTVADVPRGTPRSRLDYRYHSGCYSYDLDDGALKGLEDEERRSMDRSSRWGCTRATQLRTAAMNEQLLSPEWVDLLHRTVEEWFEKNGRDFPWRQSSNSFHILVAEVLLRRTQAHRVVGPYLELTERYSDIRDMADADVTWLREWFRPLGLVNRAQGLVEAAKTILEQHGGEVPNELSEIESLPGLGRYSACAVLCLAHAGAAPMIDESSGRLLRRLLGLSSSGPAYSDKDLFERAQRLIPSDASRGFNLGLLDIAAAYCHVGSPDCVQCPPGRLWPSSSALA